MKTLIRFSAILALALGAAVAQAGGTYTGTVSSVTAYSVPGYSPNGMVLVKFAGNLTGSPSCASSYTNYLAVDVTTAAGAEVVSLVELAYALGSTVTVGGTGACTVDSNFETLASFSSQ
jgi:hypothetical protein